MAALSGCGQGAGGDVGAWKQQEFNYPLGLQLSRIAADVNGNNAQRRRCACELVLSLLIFSVVSSFQCFSMWQ